MGGEGGANHKNFASPHCQCLRYVYICTKRDGLRCLPKFQRLCSRVSIIDFMFALLWVLDRLEESNHHLVLY